MKRIFLVFACLITTNLLFAQSTSTVQVKDADTDEPVPSAVVKENNKVLAVCDTDGFAQLSLRAGRHVLAFACLGYEERVQPVDLPARQPVRILLTRSRKELEEVSVVSSTRNNQRIERAPLKVEVLGKEEMDEENTIKPGSITSILGDISGVQIQQTSVVNGNANVRIQGLDGRYTQILRDGMPLYDGFSGDFGLLSIPPLDLKQLELIKGSASTLYGGGAIGGLVNLISKTPTVQPQSLMTLNQTTLGETNLNTFWTRKYQRFGFTLYGGLTRQSAQDVNRDGFSDVGKVANAVLHPRLFFYPDEATTLTAGYTLTLESRLGGDMMVLDAAKTGTTLYYEQNSTVRHSGEFLLERRIGRALKLSFRNSLSSFERTETTNSFHFKGRQTDYYSELSLLMPYGTHNLVAGLNVTGNAFVLQPGSDPMPWQDFSNRLAGVFIQNTWNFGEKLTLEAGLRDDRHVRYGNFLLPRLAAFYAFDKHWAVRAGVGMGYKTPNPLMPRLVELDMNELPPMPESVHAETSLGYNLEGNYKVAWGEGNQFFINQAFFLTQVSDPIVSVVATSGGLSYANAAKPIVSKGVDTYVRATVDEWEVYAGYTLTLVERTYLTAGRFMPYTPRNRFAFTLVHDFETLGGRFGLEGSYTGRQFREDGSPTPGYWFMAAMVEKKWNKHLSLVLNGENLFDFRQSRFESLFTGSTAHPTFVPLWAPIDGRVVNVSLKMQW